MSTTTGNTQPHTHIHTQLHTLLRIPAGRFYVKGNPTPRGPEAKPARMVLGLRSRRHGNDSRVQTEFRPWVPTNRKRKGPTGSGRDPTGSGKDISPRRNPLGSRRRRPLGCSCRAAVLDLPTEQGGVLVCAAATETNRNRSRANMEEQLLMCKQIT